MNYIEWELARQQTLLTRLALGTAAPADSVRTEQAPPPGGQALDADPPADGLSFRTERGGADRPVLTREADRRMYRAASAGKTGREAEGREEAVPQTEIPSERTGRQAGGLWKQGQAPYREPSGGALEKLEVLPAAFSGGTPAENLTSARAVSLCAERDARRYDGGDPLY